MAERTDDLPVVWVRACRIVLEGDGLGGPLCDICSRQALTKACEDMLLLGSFEGATDVLAAEIAT